MEPKRKSKNKSGKSGKRKPGKDRREETKKRRANLERKKASERAERDALRAELARVCEERDALRAGCDAEVERRIFWEGEAVELRARIADLTGGRRPRGFLG